MFFSWCLLLLLASCAFSEADLFQDQSPRLSRSEEFLKEKSKLSGPQLVGESVESANNLMRTALKATTEVKRNGEVKDKNLVKEANDQIKIAEMYSEMLRERAKLNSQKSKQS